MEQSIYPTIEPGKSAEFVIRFRNTGTRTWYRAGTAEQALTVSLGTSNPADRTPEWIREDIVNNTPSGWDSPNRIVMQEATVAPGQVGTFVFWMSAMADKPAGTYRDYFRLVADGQGGDWFGPDGVHWVITVPDVGPLYEAVIDYQPTSDITIQQQTSGRFTVKMRNTGRATWYRAGTNGVSSTVSLGTWQPQDRIPEWIREDIVNSSPSGWHKENRVILQEASVAPGGVGTFEFWQSAGATKPIGEYIEHFRLVADDGAGGWFGPDISWKVTVPDTRPSFAAEYVSHNSALTIQPFTSGWLQVKFRNTGSQTWRRADSGAATFVGLGTTGPADRIPEWVREDITNHSSSGWFSQNRVFLVENAVAPGDVGTFEFWYSAPADKPQGTYTEDFQLVAEGAGGGWFSTPVRWTITVPYSLPPFAAEVVDRSPDITVRHSLSGLFWVKYRNTGATTWYRADSGQTITVSLGTANAHDREPQSYLREDVVDHNPSGWCDKNRVILQEASVPPGGVGTFMFFLSPAWDKPNGIYPEDFELVADGPGGQWFGGTTGVRWVVTIPE